MWLLGDGCEGEFAFERWCLSGGCDDVSRDACLKKATCLEFHCAREEARIVHVPFMLNFHSKHRL